METGIYEIVCTPTGRRYVGSAAVSFARRWDNHKSELRRGVHKNRYMQRSWAKYGAGAFEFRVVERCSPEKVIVREQHYIDTTAPEFNVVLVAGSTRGFKMTDTQRDACAARMRGHRQALETIEKRRQSRSGYTHSAETRAKMSAAAGHTHTAEARARMSVAKRAAAPRYAIEGEMLTAVEIADRFGLKYTTVHERIRRGHRGAKLTQGVRT